MLLTLGHAAALTAGWIGGWRCGLAAMAGLHLLLAIVTFTPLGICACRGTRRFASVEKEVCLTIDDGPAADTEAVLALLERHQVKAVFFLIGRNAAARPEDTARIQAAGHLTGNHTQNHRAGWHWAFGPQRLSQELMECQQTLQSLTGMVPELYRPPAGFANPFTSAVLRGLSLHCLGWTARGFDATDTCVERVLRRILRDVRPGAIILTHQGQPHHLEILTRLLAWLEAHGWQAVLPPELEAGEKQPASY